MKRLFLNKYSVSIFMLATISALAVILYAQTKPGSRPMMDHENCPMMKKADHASMNHYEMVKQNGEKEMGFSQTATTHHFILLNDGGAIRIDVNEAADAGNKENIRSHLKEIAGMFAAGDFATPFAIHGEVPPGVTVMQELKDRIGYKYEETESGGQVRITTNDPKALAAIHEFLRFQIEDHQTGDPLE